MSVKKTLAPASVASPTANFSLGVRSSRFVFTGGQTGTDPQTGDLAPDLTGQIRRAFANLSCVLESGGSNLENVVKVNCFLADTSQFNVFDELYGELMPEPYPARTTVGVSFAGTGSLLFEIDAIGRIPGESHA